MNRRLRDLTRIARRFERTVTVTGGNHYALRHPTAPTIFTPKSPSCHRSLTKLQADLRRAQQDMKG